MGPGGAVKLVFTIANTAIGLHCSLLFALIPHDQAAIDFFAEVGIVGLFEIFVSHFNPAADQFGQHELGPEDIFLPLEQSLFVILQNLFNKSFAVYAQAGEVVVEAFFHLGSSHFDAGFFAFDVNNFFIGK